MNRFINQSFALFEIAFWRIWASLGYYVNLGLGAWVAMVIIGSIILYAEAINEAMLQDRLGEVHKEAVFDLLIRGTAYQLDAHHYRAMDSFIRQRLPHQVGLPITNLVRHGWSKPLQLWPADTTFVEKPDLSHQIRLQFYNDIARWVTLEAGKLAEPVTQLDTPIEVMSTQTMADKLGLALGQSFIIAEDNGSTHPMYLQAKLTGIIKLKPQNGHTRLYAARFLDEALTIPAETFLNSLALTIVPTDVEVTWAANYDERLINISNVNRIIAGINSLRFDLTAQLQETQLLTNLDTTLHDYQRSTRLLRSVLTILGLPILGIALYYLAMVTQLIVTDQRDEIAILKSRGSSTIQIIWLLSIQNGFIVLVAGLLAPTSSVLAAQLISQASNFMVFDQPALSDITVRPHLYAYLAFTGLFAMAAMVGAMLPIARLTLVGYRRLITREVIRPWIHRYYLDLALIIMSGFGFVILTQNGSIISQNERGGLEFDPLLLLTPSLTVTGCAFLCLRFIPHLMQLGSSILVRTETAAPLFALQQVARMPNRYQGLMLLLIFTLSLGLFTAMVANVFNRNYVDQTRYAVGADLRTHEFDHQTSRWYIRSLEDYQALVGVKAVSPVRRVRLVGRRADIQAKGTLLAIDPETFPAVAWWRQDFQPSLTILLALLSQNQQALVTDKAFAQQHRLQTGDRFRIDVGGDQATFVFMGTFDYFPTLYPTEGSQLVARIDYLARLHQAQPTEVWLSTDAQHHTRIKSTLTETAPGLILLHNGRELGADLTDPLQTGLFGVLSLGFVAATTLSLLGFLLYEHLSLRQRAVQFGILRAIGLSVSQLIVTISVEQFVLVGLGIGIGTALGGSAGWLFIRFLQISIIAQQAIPPFLVTIPWGIILRLYFVLLLIAAVTLLVATYILRRLQTYAALRLGEI